jgi:glycosyltransferase involved in cell wall biosynthesis
MSQPDQIAFLIPTRHRRSDLTCLFESFVKQSRSPDLIMIIDGGDAGKTVEDFVDSYPQFDISYIHVDPPGLTKQRNAGLDALPENITLVGFLDDDIELMPNAVQVMLDFWRCTEPDFGGASFNIINNRKSRPTWIKRFFLVNGKRRGTVLKSGFNIGCQPVEHDTETEWLSGGATVWRADIFKSYRFEERYGGYAHFDDLDFSLSLKQSYRMLVLNDAKVLHHTREVRRDKVREFSESDIVYRHMFVKRFGLSSNAFYWAVFGLILANTLVGLKERDRSKFDQIMGYISGLKQIYFDTCNVDVADLK